MSDTLRTLTLAILDIIKDRGGNATKTKLLKLLYLAELEHFRDKGESLTGVSWVFHLYGPWFDSYDTFLDDCAAEGAIQLRVWNAHGLDGVSVVPLEEGSLSELDLSLGTKMAIQEAAEIWASAPTGELLNHVYFYTEPMQGAERGTVIDFSAVRPRKEIHRYRRSKSGADEKAIRKAREKLLAGIGTGQVEPESFTPPRYDEQFFAGIALIQDEDE